MIKRVTKQLEGQGLGLELTQAAKTLLADKGYDPTLGRPAAAPSHPAPGRGPAVRAPALEGVPGRRDHHRRRRGRPRVGHRREGHHLPVDRGLRAPAGRAGRGRPDRVVRSPLRRGHPAPGGVLVPTTAGALRCPPCPSRRLPPRRAGARLAAVALVRPAQRLPGEGAGGHQGRARRLGHRHGGGRPRSPTPWRRWATCRPQLRVDDLKAAGWTVTGPTRTDRRLHLGAGHQALRRPGRRPPRS